MKANSVTCFAILAFSTPALADLRVISINVSAIPYDLGPNKYDNSPSKYDNSSSKYDNSESTYDNSASTYDNSPSKYDNGPSGKRRLITSDSKMIGYYVYSKKGILNFYNSTKRVAYMPAGGSTQSIFASNGAEWCGTVTQSEGQAVIGLTPNCLLRFYADQ